MGGRSRAISPILNYGRSATIAQRGTTICVSEAGRRRRSAPCTCAQTNSIWVRSQSGFAACWIALSDPCAGMPIGVQEIATGGTRPENLLLATPQYLSRNKPDVRLSSAARVIDPSRHTVVDQSGGVYRYGKLLSRPALPCRLPFPADLDESPERPSLNYGTLNKIGEVTLGVI